jgi:hypothetical protein
MSSSMSAKGGLAFGGVAAGAGVGPVLLLAREDFQPAVPGAGRHGVKPDRDAAVLGHHQHADPAPGRLRLAALLVLPAMAHVVELLRHVRFLQWLIHLTRHAEAARLVARGQLRRAVQVAAHASAICSPQAHTGRP